jgi:hypothetical protein
MLSSLACLSQIECSEGEFDSVHNLVTMTEEVEFVIEDSSQVSEYRDHNEDKCH